MYDTVKKPPSADVRRDFKVHSNAGLKAITRDLGEGKQALYLEGTASSTVRDRHGDTITSVAQAQMLEKARGLTMWLNHDYNVPEDILGTCEESELKSVQDAEGNDILDLVIRCKVDQENPRALKAWKHVNGGTQLGFSIGGAITECEVDEENDDGSSWCPPLIINGLDLYEISLVGIPANPRSYTRNFVQEMSRGFMRNAARNPDVRKHLRRALPALRADQVTELTCSGEADHHKIVKCVCGLTIKTCRCNAPKKDVEVVSPCTHSVNASAEPQDPAPVPPVTEPITDPQLPSSDAEPIAAATAALTSIERDLVAKRVELEKLSSTVAQRAAEVSAAEAKLAGLLAETAAAETKIATLRTEEQALQKTIDELKATPTGRQTALPGGSSVRAGYQPTASSPHEARKRLGAALTGMDLVDDPALRPA
jgi:HK97 family phage prohead protease